MTNNVVSLPIILDQLEYLEKQLQTLKSLLGELVVSEIKKEKLYGSLPKTDLTFKDFKTLRHKLSTEWEKEWSL